MAGNRVGDVVVETEAAVTRAVIDRPDAMNALSPGVLRGLGVAIDTAVEQGSSTLVISGSNGTLSTGADLRVLAELRDPASVRSYVASIGRLVQRLEAAPLVTICTVTGYAVAGGLELLLACDLAVVSETAHIGDRHLEYGLLPGAGGSVRLAEALHPQHARRFLLTGEMIDGRTAAEWGLVAYAVPADEVGQTLDAVLARLARHSPSGLAEAKQLCRSAMFTDRRQALRHELEVLVKRLVDDPDAQEGMAAFVQRREPRFAVRNGSGQRDASAPLVVPPEAGAPTSADGRPVSGRWFEDLPVGTVVRHVTRRTVTETDNVLFTTMTMNPAPTHLDAEYASHTEFGRPLVNSMFTVALVVGISVPELTLGTIIAQLGLTTVDFPAPVFTGDTIRVETEVVKARLSASRPRAGVVVFEHKAFNQHDQLVCVAQRTALMHLSPAAAAS